MAGPGLNGRFSSRAVSQTACNLQNRAAIQFTPARATYWVRVLLAALETLISMGRNEALIGFNVRAKEQVEYVTGKHTHQRPCHVSPSLAGNRKQAAGRRQW